MRKMHFTSKNPFGCERLSSLTLHLPGQENSLDKDDECAEQEKVFIQFAIGVLNLQKGASADGDREEKNPEAIAPGEGETEEPEQRNDASSQQSIAKELIDWCLSENLGRRLNIAQGLQEKGRAGNEHSRAAQQDDQHGHQ